MSLATLLGLSNAPGDLDGAPLPADVARELAADGSWRRWIIEATTGQLLDVGASTYRPGSRLERHVRGRDRTCRFPGCEIPAVRCDLDHTRAFDTQGGRTTCDNLVALCRRHHRLKHETDWTYQLQPDGSVIWTAPSGTRYHQPAEDHGDDPLLNHEYARMHLADRAKRERQARRNGTATTPSTRDGQPPDQPDDPPF